jgi:hypothetical protein
MDHVPPKNLFAPPRPHNLVTVPACAACHGPTSKDDEYFRTMLALSAQFQDHPDLIGGVRDAAVRSLGRPEGRAQLVELMRTRREVVVRTPAGLYLGQATSYSPDVMRLVRVVERVTRGLFFHHHRQVLGISYGVKVVEDSITDWATTGETTRNACRRIVALVAPQQQRRIGEVFDYRHVVAAQDTRTSAWLMTFYGRMTFLCTTGPNPTRPNATSSDDPDGGDRAD